MKHTFNKEQGTWYIDLPEYLEAGLGEKGNLMMVAGADTMLDILCNIYGKRGSITLQIDTESFDGGVILLEKEGMGKDQALLEQYGHPQVDEGGYYRWEVYNNLSVWLCPVTKYVFDGEYPDKIYAKVL